MMTRALAISAELLTQFLMTPVPPGLTAEGMPPDARIVGAKWDQDRREVVVDVQSETFTTADPMRVTFRQERRP
jgi:hypothetical protein